MCVFALCVVVYLPFVQQEHHKRLRRAQHSQLNTLTLCHFPSPCCRFQAPAAWLSAFYAASSAVMSDLTPPGISQLCQGLTVLCGSGQAPPKAWTEALLAAAVTQFKSMELLQLCNLGWALGKWNYQPEEEVVAAWLEAALPLLPAATPVDLSVLLWACDK